MRHIALLMASTQVPCSQAQTNWRGTPEYPPVLLHSFVVAVTRVGLFQPPIADKFMQVCVRETAAPPRSFSWEMCASGEFTTYFP